ncbi:hypothetical protein KIPB_004446 [Kipferlia bialata]|uniref:Uncharacterized protein n=1 Tax=Kipferlia bialata TaxID=797122 RepID=A0A9K3GI96_9EUKA|nr:hypothetical protein KIPB_004446 [Kipferlia bialata]|eukprot:g4446.t1
MRLTIRDIRVSSVCKVTCLPRRRSLPDCIQSLVTGCLLLARPGEVLFNLSIEPRDTIQPAYVSVSSVSRHVQVFSRRPESIVLSALSDCSGESKYLRMTALIQSPACVFSELVALHLKEFLDACGIDSPIVSNACTVTPLERPEPSVLQGATRSLAGELCHSHLTSVFHILRHSEGILMFEENPSGMLEISIALPYPCLTPLTNTASADTSPCPCGCGKKSPKNKEVKEEVLPLKGRTFSLVGDSTSHFSLEAVGKYMTSLGMIVAVDPSAGNDETSSARTPRRRQSHLEDSSGDVLSQSEAVLLGIMESVSPPSQKDTRNDRSQGTTVQSSIDQADAPADVHIRCLGDGLPMGYEGIVIAEPQPLSALVKSGLTDSIVGGRLLFQPVRKAALTQCLRRLLSVEGLAPSPAVTRRGCAICSQGVVFDRTLSHYPQAIDPDLDICVARVIVESYMGVHRYPVIVLSHHVAKTNVRILRELREWEERIGCRDPCEILLLSSGESTNGTSQGEKLSDLGGLEPYTVLQEPHGRRLREVLEGENTHTSLH